MRRWVKTPNRSWLGSVAAWAEQVSKVIAVGAAVGGGLFAAWQFAEKVQQDRVAQSMKFVETFRLSESRKSTIASIIKEAPAIMQLARESVASGNGDALKARRIEVALKDREPVFWEILELYQIGAVCVQERLCDCKSLVAFMGEEAKRTKVWFYPAVEAKRVDRNDPSVGIGLDYLALQAKRNCPTAGWREAMVSLLKS